MEYSRFEAIGAFLPDASLTTKDLIGRMSYRPPFDLGAITGIQERRVHDKRPESFEDSYYIALRAAQDCLARSRYTAGQLDVIISCSITRFKGGYTFYFEPSLASMMARELGAEAAIHFDVSNACAGMMTGVEVLDRMIRAGVVRNGMVVSGECITPIADTAVLEVNEMLDPQFASLTVGDAGAAVIMDRAVDEDDRLHFIKLFSNSAHSKLCIGMPSEKNDTTALYTDNRQMHCEDRLSLWPMWLRDYLRERGTSFASEAWNYVIHHQVGARFVSNVQKRSAEVLETEMPAQLSSLSRYGNTASTAHFVVLYDHLKRKLIEPGSKLLMAPAASGIVTGALSTTLRSLAVEG
jgi:3-oxoacyl-[acyl-carrier-protein] synthase III